MIYNNDIKEEIRQRNNIVDVISSYVSLKKNGSNYMGLCPFHSEKSPSFSVSPSRQMYHCFGCGVSGDVFMFVEEYENYTFGEALKFLADRAGIELPQYEMSEQEKKKAGIRQQLLDIHKLAAGYYYYILNSPTGQHGLDYLTSRQLTPETIKKFGLGYSEAGGGGLYKYLKSKGYEDSILSQAGLFTFDERRGAYDKFWNRVMFPIMDTNNKVIGFGGRVMSDAKPKYLNSPETMLFDKSKNLFGINYARLSRKDYIIICEGYMDVISLHQAGFTNVVAPLGTALTAMQGNLLKRYVNNVYLSFDSDEAGVKAALRAIPILKSIGISTKIINLSPYKDPDELIKAEGVEGYSKRIDEAMNSFYFEVDVEAKKHNMKDPEERTTFVNNIAKRLLEFTEEIERNIYADAVAEKYNIDSKDFRKLINRLGAQIVIGAGNEEIKNSNEKIKERPTIDSAVKLAQRLILTWLGDDVTLFKKLDGIISPRDFTDPVYNRAASILFQQYMDDKQVAPARIPGDFEDKQEQAEVAAIFTADLNEELLRLCGYDSSNVQISNDIKERALNQVVQRVKMYNIENELRNATEIDAIRKCSQEKKKLQELYIKL